MKEGKEQDRDWNNDISLGIESVIGTRGKSHQTEKDLKEKCECRERERMERMCEE